MKRKVVAVSEVNHYVSRLLDEDYMLSDIWISGEISNCKYHHSGHIYFTIKDALASMNAVMFAKDSYKLSFKLTEGLKIFARARISLYEKTGAYQAYVYDLEKQGMGVLYEKFERLKLKLLEEGLFNEAFKRPLPKIPKKVGVITSSTGAAIKDIIQVAKRRNPSIPIYIYPSHVQGEYAKEELVRAIEKANKDALVDVLIVGRGGGSIEDLWPFNEEEVARAIFASQIPIVSAVGHEIDFTIADFVSDLRAATPSAAAEVVFPSSTEYLALLERYKGNLKYMVEGQLKEQKSHLDYLLSRPVYASKQKFFENWMLEIDDLHDALNVSYKDHLKALTITFENHVDKLHKLSPLNTLKRGYSVVATDKDKVITSTKAIEVGDLLNITVSDGTFKAKVQTKG